MKTMTIVISLEMDKETLKKPKDMQNNSNNKVKTLKKL